MWHTEVPPAMPFLRPGDRRPAVGVPAPSASWRFSLAADDPCFAGHFDGEPVLPGIVHVAVAIEACALWQPGLPALVAVEDLRFMRPVLPGDACEVTVATAAASSVRFEIRCDEAAASRGVLVFAGPWAPR